MTNSRRDQRPPSLHALNKGLGARIRVLREERGLTRKELAERSEVALSSLSLLEGGDGAVSPNLKTIHALAHVLRVRVADLFMDEPHVERAKEPKPLLSIVERLRGKNSTYLKAVERVVRAFEAGVDSTQGSN